jgi:hypothetical protein
VSNNNTAAIVFLDDEHEQQLLQLQQNHLKDFSIILFRNKGQGKSNAKTLQTQKNVTLIEESKNNSEKSVGVAFYVGLYHQELPLSIPFIIISSDAGK